MHFLCHKDAALLLGGISPQSPSGCPELCLYGIKELALSELVSRTLPGVAVVSVTVAETQPAQPGGDEVQRRGEEGGSEPGQGDSVHSQSGHPAVREDVEAEVSEGTPPTAGTHSEEGPGGVSISRPQLSPPHYGLPPLRLQSADVPELLLGGGLAPGSPSYHIAQVGVQSGVEGINSKQLALIGVTR